MNFITRIYQRIGRRQYSSPPVSKIFVTDSSTPCPDQDSGSVTTFFMLKILVELGYDVTFAPDDLKYQGEYTEALRALGIQCLHKTDIETIKKHLKKFGGHYSVFILFRAPIAARHLANIRKYAPHALVVLETVDLHYLRAERAALITNTSAAALTAQKTKQFELGVIAKCDVSIVISVIEKELLTLELPNADIRLLPLLFYNMPSISTCSVAQRKDILFIGGFRHSPNVDAVIYFCKKIWPLVYQSLPDVRFIIIGSHPPPEIIALSQLPGVETLGHVKNLEPIFSTIRLSVAPIRYGAGLKGKIATSLGHGIPVVATSIAIEGMNLLDNTHVIVADDPVAFSDAVVRVYKDPALWSHLSQNGFERIDELYSETAGRAHCKNLMDSLKENKRREI